MVSCIGIGQKDGIEQILHKFRVQHLHGATSPFRGHPHPLVESLQFEVVVRYDLALRTFSVRPSGFTEAVNRALACMATDDVETTWASSLASVAPDQ